MSLKEMVLKTLSNMKNKDIIETLKTAGIDQDGIDVILNLVKERRDDKGG